MEVSVLSFSGRANGNCAAIAQEIAEQYADAAVYSFAGQAFHPCGPCQAECFQDRAACPYVDDGIAALYHAVLRSGLSYFVVPNYCDYPCSQFFLFNERSQCVFQGLPQLLDAYLAVPKRFVVVSNTGRNNFVEAFKQHAPEPDILFLSAKRYGKTSLRGDLMDAPQAREDLRAYVCRKV